MTRKHKRRLSGSASATSLVDQVRRQLSKGDTRQAVKEARVLFRREPSPAHRQLLADACLARAEYLRRAGMLHQAQDTFRELLQLGPTTPETDARTARLRVLLGIPDGAVPSLADLDASLAEQLSDQAMVRPAQVPAVYGDLLAQAARVRESLQAIERGDDQNALDLLQDVGRTSPLADWKLFARGLSAHYAGDAARRDSNWQRLNPQRVAYRIAQVVLVHCGARDAAAVEFDVTRRLRRLEYALVGDEAHRMLNDVAVAMREQRTGEVLRHFRTLVMRHAQSHTSLVTGATEILWKHLVRTGDGARLRQLMNFAPAPVLDPHWHRAEALLLEQDRYIEMNRLEQLWQRYAADLTRVAGLRDDECQVAQALVNLRLARHLKQTLNDCETDRFFGDDGDRPRGGRSPLRKKIVDCYRTALRHYPQLLAAHDELGQLYRDWEQPDKAVSTYQVLLKHFPSHTESLEWLARHFLEADRPLDAEPYIAEMQRLRPRDRHTQILLWNKRLALVQHAARKRNFDLARRELDEAARQPCGPATWLDAIRITIELKAHNLEVAQQLINQYLLQLDEPAVLWMVLESNAVRYGIDRAWKKEFAARLKTALAGPPSTAAAGRMAEFLSSFLQRRVKYTGLATHQRALRAYVRRCQQLTWQQRDLRHVCQYLFWDLDRGLPWSWLDRLACLGTSQFPDNPHFPFYAGSAQMYRGPYRCNIQRATQHFDQALQLNTHAADPLAPELVERAKHALTVLRNHSSLPPGLPFRFDEAFDDLDDDDDYDSSAADLDAEECGEYDGPAGRGARGSSSPAIPHGFPPELRAMMGELLELMANCGAIDPDELYERAGGGDPSRGDRRGSRRPKKKKQ